MSLVFFGATLFGLTIDFGVRIVLSWALINHDYGICVLLGGGVIFWTMNISLQEVKNLKTLSTVFDLD